MNALILSPLTPVWALPCLLLLLLAHLSPVSQSNQSVSVICWPALPLLPQNYRPPILCVPTVPHTAERSLCQSERQDKPPKQPSKTFHAVSERSRRKIPPTHLACTASAVAIDVLPPPHLGRKSSTPDLRLLALCRCRQIWISSTSSDQISITSTYSTTSLLPHRPSIQIL